MIADIHTHISTKPMFLADTEEKNCSRKLEFNIKFKLDEIFGGDIVDTQSCISQQVAGSVSFSINPIYSLEQTLGSVNSVYNMLAKNKRINQDKIRNLADGKVKFFANTKEEYALVQKEKTGVMSRAINLIDAQNKTLKAGHLNILVAIEGVHSFFNNQTEYDGLFGDALFNRIKKCFKEWSPAYLTLSHMHQNGFFSFCNGVKMSNKVQRQWFVPYNRGFEGLNVDCKRLLLLCNTHKVSIDLKHTSFANRLAIYEFISDQQMAPPIASHCGVAFMSFADYLIKNNVKKRSWTMSPFPTNKKGNTKVVAKETTTDMIINRSKGPLRLFGNCNQINLFDEDIIAIMKMGGLIGVSLDQRILGATGLLGNLRQQADQISREDGNFILDFYDKIVRDKLNINLPRLNKSKLGKTHGAKTAGLLQDAFEIARDKEKHLRYFIQTILYIIKVGYQHNIASPWKHICIGSDFDGLIDAIDVCKTSEKLPILKRKLMEYCEKHDSKSSILKEVTKEGASMLDLVEHITFFNAVNFFSNRMGLNSTDLLQNTVGVTRQNFV